MDDRNAQVGWTEAQWNRVREEVLRAWQSVRVAGSFLPVYDRLPRSTQVVPSEVFDPNGMVDERSVSPLLEIELPVILSRQQVLEEDLSSALLQFRRRATQLGQLEDWYVFNGTYPHDVTTFPGNVGPTIAVGTEVATQSYRPDYSFLNVLVGVNAGPGRSALVPLAPAATQATGLRLRNPGSLGLMGGGRTLDQAAAATSVFTVLKPYALSSTGLMNGIVDAINSLELNGYVAPYTCVFGHSPFRRAHESTYGSSVLTRDRLEPLIGREILHASAIDVLPAQFDNYQTPVADDWRSRGLLLSSAGEPIDLAIAVEATPEFRYVNSQGRYVFAVFERFALRIKDPAAVVPLAFK
jgi:uncharacterized linocin/CFP29 family protein